MLTLLLVRHRKQEAQKSTERNSFLDECRLMRRGQSAASSNSRTYKWFEVLSQRFAFWGELPFPSEIWRRNVLVYMLWLLVGNIDGCVTHWGPRIYDIMTGTNWFVCYLFKSSSAQNSIYVENFESDLLNDLCWCSYLDPEYKNEVRIRNVTCSKLPSWAPFSHWSTCVKLEAWPVGLTRLYMINSIHFPETG